MAIRIVKLPDIGEGMAEAELVEWHVKVGDLIREDQVVADVMTDKATIEIPSPAAGKVVALGGEAGQTIAIGSELLRVEVAGAETALTGGVDVSPAVEKAIDAMKGQPVSALEPAADGLRPPEPAETRAGSPSVTPESGMGIRIVKLPDIGEGMAEAELVEWHVKVGDLVREDQVLADVMTDKATIEIPSPAAGKVVALGGEAGQTIAIGSELVRLEVAGGESTPADGVDVTPVVEKRADAASGGSVSNVGQIAGGSGPPQPGEAKAKPAAKPAVRADDPKQIVKPTPAPSGRAKPSSGAPRPVGEKPLAAPSVRRRAQDAGVDLRRVHGTGPANRIGHEDLNAYLSDVTEPEPVPGPSVRVANLSVEEIKIIGLRRRIAQRMAESKRRVAHFSYVEEVDVTALEEVRNALNTRHSKTRAKLTLLPFLVAALVRALPDFPQMNALYDDEAEIVRRYGGVHVGIATQTPGGLMVPVVRHAESLDVWECATEVKRLADAARNGTAARDELTGSTISITSLGAIGGVVTTPVMNRPEVAILGVNKQAMRPVWKDGAFVPRLMMNLSSSFDHRVVDGYDAALFVQALKVLIETPALLFMDP